MDVEPPPTKRWKDSIFSVANRLYPLITLRRAPLSPFLSKSFKTLNRWPKTESCTEVCKDHHLQIYLKIDYQSLFYFRLLLLAYDQLRKFTTLSLSLSLPLNCIHVQFPIPEFSLFLHLQALSESSSAQPRSRLFKTFFKHRSGKNRT